VFTAWVLFCAAVCRRADQTQTDWKRRIVSV